VGEQLDIPCFEQRLRTAYVGRRIAHHQSVATTMDIAAGEARAGAPEGTTVLAEEQTAGRGRMQRHWVSPPGVNLYVTVIMRPRLDQLRYLAMLTPLAICEAIEEVTGLQPRIKWPNDLLIAGKKVCGILIESEIEDDRVDYALVGSGINVNLDTTAVPEISDIATSVMQECGREILREELLATWLNRFEALYEAVRRGEVVSTGWKQRLDTLGQPVSVQTPGGKQEGVAVDADSDGALILRLDDGRHIRVESGELAT
jgi:BirA family biotin operon repressor/biotin-[acetyl-CoA-carboxylase] ligase